MEYVCTNASTDTEPNTLINVPETLSQLQPQPQPQP